MTAASAPKQTALPNAALRRLFRTLFLRGRAGRRPRHSKTPRSVAAALWISLVFYGAMGNVALWAPRTSVLAFALPLHGMTFFLLSLYVAASAGEVLFNREEADILLHRPVLPQAILRAKVHVLVEITLWLAGAFNLAGLIVGGWRVQAAGWAFVLGHPLSVVLEALLCVGGVVMVYELCLRWFGRERLDGLMTAAQVLMSLGSVVIWQLIPRASSSGGAGTLLSDAWWTYLLPPYWFAGLDAVITGTLTSTTCALAATGVIITTLVVTMAFGKLATNYGEGLQVLNEHVSPKRLQSTSGGIAAWVHKAPLSWWLRDPPTRASFLLAAAYLWRDRETKLRVYPQLASVFALAFVYKLRDPGGPALGICCCLLAFTPINALESLKHSQQWQAADIFRCAPVPGPGPLCDGARRAVLACLFLPSALLLGVIAWFTTRSVNDLLVGASALVLVPLYARIPTWGGKAVPLSHPNEEMRPRRGLMYVAILLFSSVIVGCASAVATVGWLPAFLAVETAIVVGVYLVQRKNLAAVRWTSQEDA